jgi:hypothetical protein
MGRAACSAQGINALLRDRDQAFRNGSPIPELKGTVWRSSTGASEMIRFQRTYIEYRRIGFNRLDAFRFAWMVAMAGATPIHTRTKVRRLSGTGY